MHPCTRAHLCTHTGHPLSKRTMNAAKGIVSIRARGAGRGVLAGSDPVRVLLLRCVCRSRELAETVPIKKEASLFEGVVANTGLGCIQGLDSTCTSSCRTERNTHRPAR